MHEYSMVLSMLELCKEEAKKQNAKKIKNIVLEIGKFSPVEAHFIEKSFDFFKQDTICHDTKLIINMIDIKIYCKSCKKDYTILTNNFYCPKCKSAATKIVQGQELLVKSIDIIK